MGDPNFSATDGGRTCRAESEGRLNDGHDPLETP